MNHLKFLTAVALLSLAGCATDPNNQAINGSNIKLSKGEIEGSLQQLESANKDIKVKDLPYYLNKSILLNLTHNPSRDQSTQALLVADKEVDDWIAQAEVNIRKSTNDFFNYLYSETTKNRYQPKDYEKSLIGFNLALNHFQNREYELARVDAKKIAERETAINRINEYKYQSILAKEKNKNNKQITSSIENINGYPVNVLNSQEVNSLKNSYQNAGAHYLAGFIFEMQNDTSLAAPGYRLASELNPNIPLFTNSLANLEAKIKNNNASKQTSELLFVVEVGDIPKLQTFKTNFSYYGPRGARVITMKLPVIQNSNVQKVIPTSVNINASSVNLYQVANLDAMAKRQLKDDMPGYVLKSTTQAITQLVAQEAVHAAASQNKNNNGSGMAEFAAILVGVAMSVGDVDTRSWSMLPSNLYMGRAEVTKGKNNIEIPTSYGVQKIEFDASENYHIIRLRYLSDKVYVSY